MKKLLKKYWWIALPTVAIPFYLIWAWWKKKQAPPSISVPPPPTGINLNARI